MKANLQLVLYSEGAAERARMQNQMPKAWTILTSERKRERWRDAGKAVTKMKREIHLARFLTMN